MKYYLRPRNVNNLAKYYKDPNRNEKAERIFRYHSSEGTYRQLYRLFMKTIIKIF